MMVSIQGLSKAEIDELSQVLTTAHGSAKPSAGQVRTYDFMCPAKFSKPNLRALQRVFSSLERSWSGTLSTALRTEATVQVNQLEQVSFRTYAESLPASGLIFELSMDPFPGKTLIDIPGTLALSIVDRMTGGKGEAGSEPRQLSQIERNVMKCLLNRLISDLAAAWKPIASIQFAVLECYTSAGKIDIDNEELMLSASMIWNTSSVENCVNVTIQANSLDALIGELDPQRWLERGANRRRIPSELVAGLLQSVDVPLSVELGQTKASVRDVLNLEVGDIIRLDAIVEDPLNVRVGGRSRFQARPGLSGNRLSVQVINRVEEAKLAKDLPVADLAC